MIPLDSAKVYVVC